MSKKVPFTFGGRAVVVEAEEEEEVAAKPQAGKDYVYECGVGAGLHIHQICSNMVTEGPAEFLSDSAAGDFTGFSMWTSAPLLTRYIIEQAGLFEGKEVLELGSGAGLPSLAVAKFTKAKSVLLTEYEQRSMQNMVRNIRLNFGNKAGEKAEGAAADAGSSGEVVAGAAAGAAAPASLEDMSIEQVEKEEYVSGTGVRVSCKRISWEDETSWPQEEAAEGAAAAATVGVAAAEGSTAGSRSYKLFDLIIASDLVPRWR